MKFRGTCALLLLALLLPPCVRAQEQKEAGNAPSAEAQAASPVPVPDTALIDDASDRPVLQGSSNVSAVPPAPQHPAAAPAGTEGQSVKRQPFTSVSASKQFHVTGMDSLLAGAIATRADSIRTALVKILKQPDEWKNNIIIRLVGEPGSPVPANPIRMQTVIVGNTLSYNIFIHLGRGINQDRLRHAIVSTLLYEMMLRTVDPEGLPDEVTLPPWLIAGLEQAVLWHTNEADRAMYSTLFQQSGIMTPEEILNCPEPEKELDATSYAAYQTSCGALVLCLLNQENGPEGMKQLLDQAILGNDDPRNLIKRHFPQLNLTPSSLHKWWTLQLSRMATPPLTETLTITETERHLQEALTLVKYDPDTRTTVTFPLDNLDQANSLTDLNRQLSNISGSLLNLSRRSFPAYRPVIVEYAKLVALMQTGKINGREAAPKIGQLREIRELSMKTARRVRDYMDWYEINTRSGTGKTFASYAAAVKLLREQEQPANTPISRYLDDIEKLYTHPAKAPVPSLHGKN